MPQEAPFMTAPAMFDTCKCGRRKLYCVRFDDDGNLKEEVYLCPKCDAKLL